MEAQFILILEIHQVLLLDVMVVIIVVITAIRGEHSSYMFLDTPSGSGSESYKIEWMQGYSGGYTSYTVRDKQGSQDPTRGRIPSSLTLMEVSG